MNLPISDRGDGDDGHIEGVEKGPSLYQAIARRPSEEEYEDDNNGYEQVAYKVQLCLSFWDVSR